MRIARWGEIIGKVRKADVVLEVIDARNPGATRSPVIEKLIQKYKKPLILVINKMDIADPSVVEEWKKEIEEEGITVVCTSTKKMEGIRELKETLIKMKENRERVIGYVIGFPKTGKSSIINALKGKKSAPTSPIPGSTGYTKGYTIYKIDEGVYLFDSPGMIPAEGGPLEGALRGKEPERLKNPTKVAVEMLRLAIRYNPEEVKTVLKLQKLPHDPFEMLEEYAKKRGFFYRSLNSPNTDEAAREIIRFYHKGELNFTVPPKKKEKKKMIKHWWDTGWKDEKEERKKNET
ncbi:MAG: GTPase [Candidatus Korarchaeota archaeon]